MNENQASKINGILGALISQSIWNLGKKIFFKSLALSTRPDFAITAFEQFARSSDKGKGGDEGKSEEVGK